MAPEALTVERRTGTHADHRILHVSGRLDWSTADVFLEQVRTETAPVVILDLAGLDSADSRGIGALTQIHASLHRENRRFAVAGLTTKVQYVLRITRLIEVIRVFASVSEAEAALSNDAGVVGR